MVGHSRDSVTLLLVDQVLHVFRSQPLMGLHRWLWDSRDGFSILQINADFSTGTAEPTPNKSHCYINARLM